MTQASGKNSSRSELWWNRFEKSGSIQAYLRFRKAETPSADTASPEATPAETGIRKPKEKAQLNAKKRKG
jgi:hypothetical protein